MTDLRLRWILLAFCLVALVLTVPLAGQDLPTAKPEEVGVCPEKVQELSAFMQSLVDQGQIAGGVTMMARHGKVIHLEAVGMADREEKKPMRTDSIFRIASMTKPITSVAIMMLWEQGKLDLDDPVSKYITEFEKPQVLVSVDPWVTRPAEREITIRHLLTHTSGLGYPVTEKVGPIYRQNGIEWGLCTTNLTLERNIRILAKLPLAFEPGTEYQYGMSTDVLGRVVERASGIVFDRFIESNICKPLGMADTFFRVPPEKKQRLVAAYVPGKDGIQNVPEQSVMRHDLTFGIVRISSDYPYSQSHRLLSGGAGLCSTASDYMRFALMILNGGQLHGVPLLTDQSVHMMTTNQVENRREDGGIGFGFGIYRDTETSPLGLRSSYASSGFWSTHCRISPQGDWTVIVMSQLAWDFDLTPQWFAEYEKIAAEAIQN